MKKPCNVYVESFCCLQENENTERRWAERLAAAQAAAAGADAAARAALEVRVAELKDGAACGIRRRARRGPCRPCVLSASSSPCVHVRRIKRCIR